MILTAGLTALPPTDLDEGPVFGRKALLVAWFNLVRC